MPETFSVSALAYFVWPLISATILRNALTREGGGDTFPFKYLLTLASEISIRREISAGDSPETACNSQNSTPAGVLNWLASVAFTMKVFC